MGADQADGRQPWSKQQRQDNHELADIRPHWTQRLKRGFTATALLVLTVLLVDGGHACVSVALVVVQTICFGELVAVSYQEAQRDTSEAISPLFRTMQWAWFAVAMAIAYSTDFLKAPMFAGDKLASVAARFLGQPAGQITADIADFVSRCVFLIALPLHILTHRVAILVFGLMMFSLAQCKTCLCIRCVSTDMKHKLHLVRI